MASNSSVKVLFCHGRYPKRDRYLLNCDMPVILLPLPAALVKPWMLQSVTAIFVAGCANAV